MLVLASNMPEAYKQVKEIQKRKGLLDWQAKQEVFGVTHAEVWAYLLGLWGVGEAIVEAVAITIGHPPATIWRSVRSPRCMWPTRWLRASSLPEREPHLFRSMKPT